MGALAQEGTPLATIITQAQDLADQAKQCLDTKVQHLSDWPDLNRAIKIHAPRDLTDQWATSTMPRLEVETLGLSWMRTEEVKMLE